MKSLMILLYRLRRSSLYNHLQRKHRNEFYDDYISTILRVYLGRLNKKLDQEEGIDLGTDAHDNEEHGLPGLAVRQGFRFLL